MAAEPAASLAGVGHTYPGGRTALVDVQLDLEPGEMVGLVGPNGSGKSTLLAVLAGRLTPSSGEVRVLDIDSPACARGLLRRRLRGRIGYLTQGLALDPETTGAETLSLFCALHGLPSGSRRARIDELTSRFGLAEHVAQRVESYSGGLKRRLHLAVGTVHGPDLLLLDEPTTGLDPQGRGLVWESTRQHARRGGVVLIASHDLEAVQRHCDRIVLLDRGRIHLLGAASDLHDRHGVTDLTALYTRLTGRQPEPVSPRRAPSVGGQQPARDPAPAEVQTPASAERPLATVPWWLTVVAAMARRTWTKTLRRPVVLTFSFAQPLLWMLFFGFLFQRYRIEAYAPDTTYLTFLAPGVAVMTVLFGASQSGISLVRDHQTGVLARVLGTPARRDALLAGKVGADVVRLLGQALVVLALGALIGARLEPAAAPTLLAFAGLALFGGAFAAVSCTVALLARAPEPMSTFVHLINMPMLFTSTALVPARQMPEWLQAVARWNPLTLAVDGLRGAVLAGTVPTAVHLGVLAALAAVTFPIAVKAMSRAERT